MSGHDSSLATHLNNGSEGEEALRGRRGRIAFELELRHLALDRAGIGTQCPGRQTASRQIVEQPLGEQHVVRRADWCHSAPRKPAAEPAPKLESHLG